jgi:hypothetical protein
MLTPRELETDRLVRKGITTMWDSARTACVQRLTQYKVRLTEEFVDSLGRVGPTVTPTTALEASRAAAFFAELVRARPSLVEAMAERYPETA